MGPRQTSFPNFLSLSVQQRAWVQQELMKAISPFAFVPACAAVICDVSSNSVSLPRLQRCLSCSKSPQFSLEAFACPMDFLRVGQPSD